MGSGADALNKKYGIGGATSRPSAITNAKPGSGAAALNQKYGLSSATSLPKSGSKSVKEQILGNKGVQKGLGAVAVVGDILDRPGNAVRNSALSGNESGLKGNLTGFVKGFTGKEKVSFHEAIHGRGSKASGVGESGLDIAGSILSDPTTYITFGASAAAKQGLKSVAKVGGKEALEAVAKQGARKGLSDAARASVKQELVDQAIRTGIRPRRSVLEVLSGTAKGGADEAAERFSNRALNALDVSGRGGIVARIPGTKIGTSLAPAKELEVFSKAGKAFKGSNTGQKLARTFKADAEAKQLYGDEAGAAVHALRRERETKANQLIEKWSTQIKAAQRLVPDYDVVDDKIAQEALDIGGSVSQAMKDHPRIAPIIKALDDVRHEVEAVQLKAGVLDDRKVGNINDYLHRQLTPEGAKALEKNPSLVNNFPNQARVTLNQGGALKKRDLYPELPAQSVNELVEPTLREAGVLQEGEKFFHEGALAPSLSRAQKAAEAVAEGEYVKGLVALTHPTTGKKLISGTQIDKSYESVDLGELGKFWAPKEIVDDLKKVRNVTLNEKDLNAIAKGYDKTFKLWKSLATSVPIGNAFTGRNARGNFFLNYLAGGIGPQDYVEAGRFQKQIRSVLKGKQFQEEIAAGKLDDVLRRELGEESFKIWSEAKRTDVIGTAFFKEDLGVGSQLNSSVKGTFRQATGKAKAKAVVKQFGTEGKVLQAGAKWNSVVEDNARLAHFIAKSRELGDFDEAAKSVKKYLFDYGELSKTEKEVFKRMAPFYTFMRKNTPLQIERILKDPGKYTARAHVIEGVTDPNNDDEVPRYLQGGRTLKPGLAKLLTGRDERVVTKPDSPFAGALESLEFPLQAASYIPGVKKVAPGLEPQDGGEVARKFMSYFGGPVPAVGNYAASEATGVNTFTRGQVKGSGASRAAKALIPATSKVEKVQDFSKAGLLKTILGLDTTELTPKQKAFAKRLAKEARKN